MSTAFQKKTLALGLLASFVEMHEGFVEKIAETSRRWFLVSAYTYVVQKI